ncbi:MAG: response regulator [Candidatus Heimdallarchaeota archaeon]|nr:response regulator [Candidatus Heimdallarchaeota archaeon]
MKKGKKESAIIMNIENLTKKELNKQLKLRQLEKLEAVSVFVGGVAHEFNNLLTIVQGHIELLSNKMTELPPEYSDSLKKISSASYRMNKLINQLLYFGRKQELEKSPFNVNEVINYIKTTQSQLNKENLTIKLGLASNLWKIKGDRKSIEQLLMDLIVSTKERLQKHDAISIKTNNIIVDDIYCEKIPDAYIGRFVRIVIEDTGAAISNENLNNLFDPFFAPNGLAKGLKLTLSAMYGIVKQHDGWIEVTSNSDFSRIFNIYLPAILEEIVPIKEEKTNELKQFEANKNTSILVVDDEEDICELLDILLVDKGYVVFTAENATEALDIFSKEKGNFHLIICDVVLPDKNGLELVEELLTLKSDLQVIMISGYTGLQSKISDIHEIGYTFLSKPFSTTDILNALVKKLNKKKR